MVSISTGFLLSLFISLSFFLLSSASPAGNFKKDVYLSWGEDRAKILDGGKQVTLSLDEWSGSGFESKNQYMFGRVDMDIKLVPGNSAGTVTAYFVSYFLSFFSFYFCFSRVISEIWNLGCVICITSYLLKEQNTMKSISSFWGMKQGNLTQFIPMFLPKAMAVGNSSFPCGLIQRRTSILILSSGIL